ncbi:MAG: thiamine pyrophosphate-binding protein [Bacteroidetes bacterium]|nr:MAG: thiamine pyrophosphate-binding protein [Bacteroidota bacterium]
MKKTGAALTVYALEQIGINYTFGIPGVHTTEIYDKLNTSEQIEPILVTHEGCASFMADAISRTSDKIGTLVVVPAAGMTHAMSGIGEAYLDGIPMLIISGGTRRDTGKSYQLHQLDQEKVIGSIVKKYFLIKSQKDIVKTIYEAYDLANSGEPGPVFIEIPVEIQMFQEEVDELLEYKKPVLKNEMELSKIINAAKIISESKKVGIYLGWGAVDTSEYSVKIAEMLNAPVATTLQGLSSFPANNELHTGLGFGNNATPTGQKAFKNIDCLLAVGVRFSELATGSFGVDVPENLIHIDINPEVFDKNYQSKVNIEGDAANVLKILYDELKNVELAANESNIKELIKSEKQKYFNSWLTNKSKEIVSPGFFFKSLREKLPKDVMIITDDGKHTFLTAELFPIYKPRHFISPTDFNSMGYCVPATIGVKLANPNKKVVGIAGDGAFTMTGFELITAKTHKLGIIIFVFSDGELGQISQFQKIPLKHKTATILGKLNLEGAAMATGAHFVKIDNDFEIDEKIDEAIKISDEGQAVLVDVNIDYSRKTFLTKGVVKTNLLRFPLKEKIRFISRALKRHTFG